MHSNPPRAHSTLDESIASIYVFGDQTDDFRSSLRALLCAKSNSVLDAFLKASYCSIRAEILQNPEGIGRQAFSNLLELLEVVLPDHHRVALDHALATICHFGLFLEKCGKLRGGYPNQRVTRYLGICTGSLAAAAIRCCHSPLELLPVAVRTCVLAYRVGAYAGEHASRYDIGQGGEHSWAMTVLAESGDASQVIKDFLETQSSPLAFPPYISSIWVRGATISGPPTVLRELREARCFRAAAMLPLYAPYHALDVYDDTEIERLVDELGIFGNGHDSAPLGFDATGNLPDSVPKGLRSALNEALRDILVHQVNFHNILGEVKTYMEVNKASKAVLIAVASSAGSSICQALTSESGIPKVELARETILPFNDNDIRNSRRQYNSQAEIAIVGMSCRLPQAAGVDDFWDLLHEGLDVHRVVPPTRWDASTHVDCSAKPRKNTSATPYGCWLEDPGLFDGRFFGMSPRECEQVDPASRLALLTAYEAMEDGGIVPGQQSTRLDRVGVCYGVTSNDWMETNSAQDIDTYMIPGGNRAFIPGRINYCFKFSGPSLAIDTACSSSLAAVHTACNILWRGEADTMITGGTNILTNPDFTAGLDRGRFLSRTGGCKTFDDEADGYCRGEGVATLILKRLDDAIADGDNIKGVILNVLTNHSAEAESITRPSLHAQRAIFTKVLDGLSPLNISYVEMHGTGTQVGDATEMNSLLEVVAPARGPHRRSETEGEIVHLGSVKANIGHGEAAAGATSLIKLLLMMEKSEIPPHVGIKSRLNRKFPNDMSSRGVRIASQPTAWVRTAPDRPRYALLNNFSAAGGNTTLLLRDYPRVIQQTAHLSSDARSTHMLVLSAKTATALQTTGKAMLGYLRNHPNLCVPSLSYTTTARRMHHRFRIAVAGPSIEQLTSALSSALAQDVGTSRAVTKPAIIFAFTGQGSYYVGMGRQLYKYHEGFRNNMNRYSQIALRRGFTPFMALISGEPSMEESVASSEAVQLAIVCLQMALTRLWSSWGISPSGVIGHSLGHYAALHAARVISEADTIFLVGMRARLIEAKCQPGTHKMLRVRAAAAAVSPILATHSLEIACINGQDDIVLSGPADGVELCSSELASQNVPCQVLNVPFAFHSSQVDCALKGFQTSIGGVKFHPPQVPIICPRQERVLRSAHQLGPAHLVDHLRHQVNFVAGLEAAQSEGLIGKPNHTMFLEIGHTGTLTGMLKGCLKEGPITAFPSLRAKLDPWQTLVPALNAFYQAGVDVKWDEYHRCFAKGLEVIRLPHYQWDLEDYWIQYRNDWSLRKGDAALSNSAPVSAGPSLLSTTIHRVVKEEPMGTSRSVVLRSNLSDDALHPIVQGHKVNGLPLVTPAIYADIALTAGIYLQEKYGLGKKYGGQAGISDMTVERALIVQPAGTGLGQWLQTDIEVDSDKNFLKCRFSSVEDDGNSLSVQHAWCLVTYTASIQAEMTSPIWLKEKTLEAKTNMHTMRERLATGAAYRFNSNMVYRMVAVLADFDRAYRGLKEVILDSNSLEASSTVDCSGLPRRNGEKYAVHPAYLDSLTQTAGFVMNANEGSDIEVECFVNHGWKSLGLFEPLRADKQYHCYVRMIRDDHGDGVWQGDLYVLCEDRMAAIIEGITLQGLPRRLLYHVLSTANNLLSQKGHPLAQQTASFSHEQSSIDSQTIQAGLSTIVDIVSQESGIPRAELSDDTDLAQVGVDSLLSLLITSRLKEELDYNLGSGLSIFDKFRSLKQLKDGYLEAHGYNEPSPKEEDEDGLASQSTGSPSSQRSASSSSRSASLDALDKKKTLDSESDSTVSSSTDPQETLVLVEDKSQHKVRPVTSVILQEADKPSHAQSGPPTLFLFPDGSGSAMSYASLPEATANSKPSDAIGLPTTITLIGLICPYRHNPTELARCTLDSLLASYIEEIHRRQPSGPYSLGGWSSGGIFAYRAAQMLLEAGHAVHHLVLLDSPSPAAGLETLPDRFYEHCTRTQVFGQIEQNLGAQEEKGCSAKASSPRQPEWLIAHFQATVGLLSSYHAEPLKAQDALSLPLLPSTTIVWASQSALDGRVYSKFEISAEDGDGVRFLAEARTDFGPGGWGELLPPKTVSIHVLDEFDHFSMMHGNGARALTKILSDALRTEL
ncbi:hypothetical protein BD289DRAFT_293041 [Coniella lustricola]|uniref:Uncharacterized protein n=1 Tax=Coniella lustricola TaxID=2025994 RepID=A0A2T3A573_9PEZI|nr:hypothetical protein BD289DRAFT_293041 [Coniella lustricola]